MEFAKRSGRELIQFCVLCAVPLLVLGLVSYLDHGDKRSTTFDGDKLAELQESGADVALIGNSMLGSRVGPTSIAKLAAPNRIAYLEIQGSRSLAWYLLLKNFAAQIQPPPKLAVIFYRDFDFNRIDQNVDGMHLERLRGLMRPEDEPMLRLCRGGAAGSKGWAASLSEDYLPDRAYLKVKKKISNWGFQLASLDNKEHFQLEQKVNALFDFQFLRPDAVDEGAADNEVEPAGAPEFDPGRNSFLQQFLDLAKSSDMKLCFYRVKRRPDADNVRRQTRELREYTRQFKEWAEARGHYHFDETDDPAFTLEMYHDGDHFAAPMKRTYAVMLLERIGHLFPNPMTGETSDP